VYKAEFICGGGGGGGGGAGPKKWHLLIYIGYFYRYVPFLKNR